MFCQQRMTERDIRKAAEVPQRQYSCDLTEAFPVQLVTFATSLQHEIVKFSTVQQSTHLLTVDYAAVASAFTDVVTALIAILTSITQITIHKIYTINLHQVTQGYVNRKKTT